MRVKIMAQLQALAILAMTIAYYLYAQNDVHLNLSHFNFNTEDKILTITRQQETGVESVLSGELGLNYNLGAGWVKCKQDKNGLSGENVVCVEWEGKVRLSMDYEEENKEAQCYTILWQSLTKDAVPMDCLNIGEAHWYGGAQMREQRWPIEEQLIRMQPYLGQDLGFDYKEKPDAYGAVLERYWFSSAGVAFYVQEDVPLHVSNDKSKFCLKADYEHSPFPNPDNHLPNLNYTICVKDNVKDIHKYMSKQLWRKPVGIPDERILHEPIWSTWARYKVKVNQTLVLQYAKEIHDYGFPASQIEIDDMYTPAYGDFTFDTVKFPDALAMTKEVHSLGYRVTSWIMPFANLDSKAFQEGAEQGYWVMDQRGDVPGLVKWWQGVGGMLDVTNPEAVNWFFERLQVLKNFGVDSFKFDAGETTFLPPCFKTHKPFANNNPNEYSTRYAEVMAENSDRLIEVRVGYRTQHLPIMVRMFDKSSIWGYDVGLKTIITTALQFGIEGYPFILPDMIGGNAYSDDLVAVDNDVFPDKELFIRWLEVSTFLPAMQFSIAPWQYDQQTTQIALKYVQLHQHYVAPKIVELAEESTKSGDPIIRPVWWIAPDDSETFTIDSQFLIGNNLMVAPILDKGATQRDIYLPAGEWKDILRQHIVTGGKYLRDYDIQLDEIAYFERV